MGCLQWLRNFLAPCSDLWEMLGTLRLYHRPPLKLRNACILNDGNWKVIGYKFRSFGEKHTNFLSAVFEMMLFLPSKWEVAVVVVESHRDGFLHDMVSNDVSVEVLGDPLRRGWHSRPPLCPRQLHDFIRLYQSSLSYVCSWWDLSLSAFSVSLHFLVVK